MNCVDIRVGMEDNVCIETESSRAGGELKC